MCAKIFTYSSQCHKKTNQCQPKQSHGDIHLSFAGQNIVKQISAKLNVNNKENKKQKIKLEISIIYTNHFQ